MKRITALFDYMTWFLLAIITVVIIAFITMAVVMTLMTVPDEIVASLGSNQDDSHTSIIESEIAKDNEINALMNLRKFKMYCEEWRRPRAYRDCLKHIRDQVPRNNAYFSLMDLCHDLANPNSIHFGFFAESEVRLEGKARKEEAERIAGEIASLMMLADGGNIDPRKWKDSETPVAMYIERLENKVNSMNQVALREELDWIVRRAKEIAGRR